MARGKGGCFKSAGGKGKSRGGGRYRSAITGRYLISKDGKGNPKTTVKESK